MTKVDFVNNPVIADVRAALLDPQSHREAIIRAASAFLRAGDGANAFAFADRACRLAFKSPARYLSLRAEASRMMGNAGDAEEDLRAALDDDPSDPVVNEYVLQSGFKLDKDVAKIAAFDLNSGWGLIALSARALLEDGSSVVSRLSINERLLAGWAVWREGQDAQLRIHQAGGQRTIALKVDAAHPLSGEGCNAASIGVECDGPISEVGFLLGGAEARDEAVQIGRISHPDFEVDGDSFGAPGTIATRSQIVSIIIPIYDDEEATTACLQRVAKLDRRSLTVRTIVIDDCCPDPKLSERAKRLCEEFGFDYLKNNKNLGYAASINVGLEAAVEGDVLLLNSDCLLPGASLRRLVESAYEEDDVGTVTPLSNNGEFTSFPIPFRSNRLPSDDLIEKIDAIAAEVNAHALVNIPTGIGFCLFVKRAVIERIGFLPTYYGRGYCEDADFCLRARRAGLRNVCAVGIFVGHHGNSSFKASKGPLVSRNVKRLEAFFPRHRAESAAFMRADPLRGFREAIQARLHIEDRPYLTVSMASDPSSSEVADARWPAGDQLSARLLWSHAGQATLFGATAGPILQSRSWRDRDDRKAWETAIQNLRPSRIGIADPFAFPEYLSSLLLSCGAPIDLIMSASPFQPQLDASGSECRMDESACAACFLAFEYYVRRSQTERDEVRAWRKIFERAERIVTTNRLASATARRLLTPRSDQEIVNLPALSYADSLEPGQYDACRTLGVIAERASVQTDRLLSALARRLTADSSGWRLVVLGKCVDDLRLLSLPNVFVTGPVRVSEYANVLRRYNISALLLPERWAAVDALESLQSLSALPVALFDWTLGALKETKEIEGALTLDPRLCDKRSAESVTNWLSGLILEKKRPVFAAD